MCEKCELLERQLIEAEAKIRAADTLSRAVSRAFLETRLDGDSSADEEVVNCYFNFITTQYINTSPFSSYELLKNNHYELFHILYLKNAGFTITIETQDNLWRINISKKENPLTFFTAEGFTFYEAIYKILQKLYDKIP